MELPQRDISLYSWKESKLYLGKQEHETRLQNWKDGMKGKVWWEKKIEKKSKRRRDSRGDNTWRNLLHPAPCYTVLAVALSLRANYFM